MDGVGVEVVCRCDLGCIFIALRSGLLLRQARFTPEQTEDKQKVCCGMDDTNEHDVARLL